MKVKLAFILLVAEVLLPHSQALTISRESSEDSNNRNNNNNNNNNVNVDQSEPVVPLDQGNMPSEANVNQVDNGNPISINAEIMLRRRSTVINGDVYYIKDITLPEKTIKKVKRSSRCHRSREGDNIVNVHVENSIDLDQLQGVQNQNSNNGSFEQRFDPHVVNNVENRQQAANQYSPSCECSGMCRNQPVPVVAQPSPLPTSIGQPPSILPTVDYPIINQPKVAQPSSCLQAKYLDVVGAHTSSPPSVAQKPPSPSSIEYHTSDQSNFAQKSSFAPSPPQKLSSPLSIEYPAFNKPPVPSLPTVDSLIIDKPAIIQSPSPPSVESPNIIERVPVQNIICECCRRSDLYNTVSEAFNFLDLSKGNELIFIKKRWNYIDDLSDVRILYSLPQLKLSPSDFVLKPLPSQEKITSNFILHSQSKRDIDYLNGHEYRLRSDRKIRKVCWLSNGIDYEHYFEKSLQGADRHILFYPEGALGLDAPAHLNEEVSRVVREEKSGEFEVRVAKSSKALVWEPTGAYLVENNNMSLERVPLRDGQAVFMTPNDSAGEKCLRTIKVFLNLEMTQKYNLLMHSKWIGALKGCVDTKVSAVQLAEGKIITAKMDLKDEWNYSVVPSFESNMHMIENGSKWVLSSRPAFSIYPDGRIQLDYQGNNIVAALRYNDVLKLTETFRLNIDNSIIFMEKHEDSESCLRQLNNLTVLANMDFPVPRACRNLWFYIVRPHWEEN